MSMWHAGTMDRRVRRGRQRELDLLLEAALDGSGGEQLQATGPSIATAVATSVPPGPRTVSARRIRFPRSVLTST